MEDKVAAVTVTVELPEALPRLAETIAVPAETAVAKPPLVTVITGVFDEPQVTCMVISWLVPSEYVPMAVNCGASPTGIRGLAGITDMKDRVAAVTVRVVVPVTCPVGG